MPPRLLRRAACLMVLCLQLISISNATTMTKHHTSTISSWPVMGSSKQQQKNSSSDIVVCPTKCRCRFFIWNFISYIKYKETMYQVKQNTLEGKGGIKFIRIQPDTLLSAWYPQLRKGLIKPDACCICGYSWKDHLEFWWYLKKRKGCVSKEFESYIKS